MLAAAVVVLRTASADLVGHKVKLAPIGHPIWQLAGFQLFSAPIGTFTDGFAEFFQNDQKILPPPNHLFLLPLGIVPGAPHQPPYGDEMVDGVKSAGFKDKIVFRGSEFSIPNGVWLTWMVVPGSAAPTGSTPDYANGPIIPKNVFPIAVTARSFRNGAVFDSALASYSVTAVTTLPSPCASFPNCTTLNVDGYSHFPNFIANAVEVGPGTGPEGSYVYSATITDATGNGWTFSMSFRINRSQQGQ